MLLLNGRKFQDSGRREAHFNAISILQQELTVLEHTDKMYWTSSIRRSDGSFKTFLSPFDTGPHQLLLFPLQNSHP